MIYCSHTDITCYYVGNFLGGNNEENNTRKDSKACGCGQFFSPNDFAANTHFFLHPNGNPHEDAAISFRTNMGAAVFSKGDVAFGSRWGRLALKHGPL